MKESLGVCKVRLPYMPVSSESRASVPTVRCWAGLRPPVVVAFATYGAASDPEPEAALTGFLWV